jgi:cell wall-associated NlpC family hydrolase
MRDHRRIGLSGGRTGDRDHRASAYGPGTDVRQAGAHEGDTRDVASHRLKRTMRGALAAGAVIAAVGMTPTPATAAPPATTPSNNDPMSQYQTLSKQADALNEQINNAKVELAAQQALATKANGAITAAKNAAAAAQVQENQYRGQVDQLADASYEGARFNNLSALLTGTSTQDFLNRASDLQELASANYDVITKFEGAIRAADTAEQTAETAQQTAQAAITKQNTLLAQLNAQSQQLSTQKAQVQTALSRLSSSARETLNTDIGPSGTFIPPSGIAGAAMEMALNQRGKPYVYGADGPGSFDCSGLDDYAYELAGMGGLPHSAAALSHMGVAVPRSELQPGDLVFFGSPAYHVGIYVGGGEMVDAPSGGQVVKVQPLFSGYSGARRLG